MAKRTKEQSKLNKIIEDASFILTVGRYFTKVSQITVDAQTEEIGSIATWNFQIVDFISSHQYCSFLKVKAKKDPKVE